MIFVVQPNIEGIEIQKYEDLLKPIEMLDSCNAKSRINKTKYFRL